MVQTRTIHARTRYALLVALLSAVPATAQEEAAGAEAVDPQNDAAEQRESTLQTWRETLAFGINSEIVELLPLLADTGERELAPDVLRVFAQSRDPAVLSAALEYLNALELDDGIDRARSLVLDYRDIPPDLATELIRYLRDSDAESDEALEETLTDLAARAPVARATAAVDLMQHLGVAPETLIQLYESGDLHEEVRGQVLLSLGDRGDRAAYEFVSQLIGEDQEATTVLQRYALDTLGRLGDERAVPRIVRQMSSNDALTRAYAASALGHFATEEAREALIAALRDDFWRVRVAALEAIEANRFNEALPAVAYKARRDPERTVRLAAIATLRELDAADGWSVIEERARSASVSLPERSAALAALVADRPAASVDVLQDVIDQEWTRENSAMLDAVGRLVSTSGNAELRPVVERLLSHPNFIIQIYAVRAAGHAAIGSLRDEIDRRTAEEHHPALRREAVRALERIERPE